MNVQLELWHLILLLLAWVGGVASFGKILLDQFEKRLGERFAGIEAAKDRQMEKLESLERDFLQWKGELPLNYVRREDYIRGQSVIEAKIDGLALRWENAQMSAQLREKRPHD